MRTLMIIATALTAAVLNAQQISGGATFNVRVQPAATAEEQLQRAAAMRQEIYQAPDPQRRAELLAQTYANISIVRKQWPSDTGALLKSSLMIADLSLEWNMPQNVIDALEPIGPKFAATDYAAGIERRIGQAYERLGKRDEAEQHLKESEKAATKRQLNRVERQLTLTALAEYYRRGNKATEAIACYHEIEKLPDQTDLNRAIFGLASLETAVAGDTSSDHSLERQELQILDDHIYNARRKGLPPDQARAIESIAKRAQTIKNQHKF